MIIKFLDIDFVHCTMTEIDPLLEDREQLEFHSEVTVMSKIDCKNTGRVVPADFFGHEQT